jgi:hypothetical protein
MTWDEVRAIALSFPGVEESTSYGTPAFKVRNKVLTRLRAEEDSLVLLDVTFDEREMLIEAEPDMFHTTAHYKSFPAVLARLAHADPAVVRAYLERRWRNVAPQRLVKARDQ